MFFSKRKKTLRILTESKKTEGQTGRLQRHSRLERLLMAEQYRVHSPMKAIAAEPPGT